MRPHQQSFVRTMLARSPVMAAIAPVDVERLFEAASAHSFPRRASLDPPGEQSRHLFLMMRGQAELTTGSAEGDEVTIAAFGPGSWINWLAVIDPIATERSFQIAAGSTVIGFPAPLVREVMARNIEAFPILYRELGTRFRALMRWTERSALSRDTRRLANLLVMLVRVGGDDQAPYIARMSQERLARLSDCSRQTLNCRLAELQRLGLVERGYGQVRVTDLARLERFAETDRSTGTLTGTRARKIRGRI